MKMNFECHITCLVEEDYQETRLRDLGAELGWTFSKIDGDPVLGAGVKCYLTRHDYEYMHIHTVMSNTRAILVDESIKVIREKIELIMHDKRSLP